MTVTGVQAPMRRKHWMSVLAKSSPTVIESACKPLGELPRFQWLRQPETGLVMVRGRIGGSGAKFNLGEVPVTRCTLSLESGTIGMAWVQGRDTRHAELAAHLDALLQDLRYHERISTHVITPLAAQLTARRELAARKAAATKVEFYTMARETPGTENAAIGEDK